MIKCLAAVIFMLVALNPASAAEPVVTDDVTAAFAAGAIVVKGEGAAPEGPFTRAQKRIMALRAAKAVALREAFEMLDEVTVTGETTVMNAASESDVISTAAEGVVRGAAVVREEYDPAAGLAVVYISVPMAGAAGSLMPSVAGLVPDMPAYSPPMSASTARYDGVIIDARGRRLKPALVNRIVSKKGEVIYDPSKVAPGVLAARGGAGYTNDVAKAKAILAERGSSNPLVVKASGVSRSTDAELGPIEAGAVFFANQATGFFGQARVVFVLD